MVPPVRSLHYSATRFLSLTHSLTLLPVPATHVTAAAVRQRPAAASAPQGRAPLTQGTVNSRGLTSFVGLIVNFSPLRVDREGSSSPRPAVPRSSLKPTQVRAPTPSSSFSQHTLIRPLLLSMTERRGVAQGLARQEEEHHDAAGAEPHHPPPRPVGAGRSRHHLRSASLSPCLIKFCVPAAGG